MNAPTTPGLAVENFDVIALQDGATWLQGAAYGRGCWWETEFGSPWMHDLPGSDLGSLLDAARAHLRDAHGGAG